MGFGRTIPSPMAAEFRSASRLVFPGCLCHLPAAGGETIPRLSEVPETNRKENAVIPLEVGKGFGPLATQAVLPVALPLSYADHVVELPGLRRCRGGEARSGCLRSAAYNLQEQTHERCEQPHLVPHPGLEPGPLQLWPTELMGHIWAPSVMDLSA